MSDSHPANGATVDPAIASSHSSLTTTKPRNLATSPWAVAGTTFAVYSLWLLLMFFRGHDARDFVMIYGPRVAHGQIKLKLSHATSSIRLDPNYPPELNPNGYPGNPHGYDGQYAWFLAIDPINARDFMDRPAYRYARIFYPMIARALAWGNPGLVARNLIAINLIAITACVLLLAEFLRRRRGSPWLALLFGFFPGIFVCLRRDLTEPLAFALAIAAMFVLHYGRKRRIIYAGVLFALADLTREQMIIFPLVYGAVIALAPSAFEVEMSRPESIANGNHWWNAIMWRPALLLIGISLAPLYLYKLFLFFWLGSTGTPTSNLPAIIPFSGLLSHWSWRGGSLGAVSVVPAALILAVIAIRLIRNGTYIAESWLLIVNVVLFVVLLNASSYVNYGGLGRVTAGIVITGILVWPGIKRMGTAPQVWFWICAIIWFTGWIPVASTGQML